MKSPFPYFGGKRLISDVVWSRLGSPKQYIEPFCGSCAILLSAPSAASLEVIGDANGFIANFWRAVVHQPAEVAKWADYPVSHVDLGARHVWLMGQRDRIGAELQDANWPGDAKVAGWWLWGQCAWLGSGWCEWEGKVPRVSDSGAGIQAIGKVPRVSDDWRADAMWTSCGRTELRWLGELAERLERVRVVHGSWDRCLNNHFGGDSTAVFLDPPYDGFEGLYRACSVAHEAEEWARDNEVLRVCLCGHRGDYDLPGWEIVEWARGRPTYSGRGTTEEECLWFSPACLKPTEKKQLSLLGGDR